MVIQCEKCDTRFRLPDDRLKPEGVKVRCSHCKEVFTVYPPSGDPPAPSAPEPDAVPEPSTAAGGGSDDLDFDSAFADESEASAPSDDAFSIPEGDEAGESAGESDDFGFDFNDGDESEAGQSPNEFAFDEGGWDDEGGGDKAAETEGGASEFSFDDSTWDEGQDTGEAPPEAVGEAGEEVGGGTKDEFSFDEEDWSDSPAPSSEVASGGVGGFDSDFGIEDNSAIHESPPAPSPGGGEFKFTELSSARTGVDDSGFSQGFTEGDDYGFSDEDLASSVPEPPVRRQKKSSSSTLPLLLVLLLVLAGAGGFFLWQQGQLPFVDKLIQQIQGVGTLPETSRIEIKGLDHDFVENREVGTLFVVRGQAFNRFTEKRSSLQVKGELYDGNGQSLARQVVFCGNPLSNEQLAEMPFAKISDAMANQFGEALSNFEVPPGKGLPFVIVFRSVPENLVEYAVDVVGSQPVAQ